VGLHSAILSMVLKPEPYIGTASNTKAMVRRHRGAAPPKQWPPRNRRRPKIFTNQSRITMSILLNRSLKVC